MLPVPSFHDIQTVNSGGAPRTEQPMSRLGPFGVIRSNCSSHETGGIERKSNDPD